MNICLTLIYSHRTLIGSKISANLELILKPLKMKFYSLHRVIFYSDPGKISKIVKFPLSPCLFIRNLFLEY